MEELKQIRQLRLTQQQSASKQIAQQRRREWTLILLCLAVVVFLGVNFKLVKVDGQSMQPTYQNGQLLMVWRTAPLFGEYSPGDVIVFRQGGAGALIKRVVFVQSPDGQRRMPRSLPTPEGPLPVNLLVGIDDRTDFPGYWDEIAAAEAGVILNKTIFVMGDNVWNSEDSRDFGPIDPSSVLGKVILPVPHSLSTVSIHDKRHERVWERLEVQIARA